MPDSNNEADEPCEQLRVRKVTFIASRVFVYIMRHRTSLAKLFTACTKWKLSRLPLSVLQNDFIEELVNDIIDDVTCGLCFEIHRACKLGILFLDETDPG